MKNYLGNNIIEFEVDVNNIISNVEYYSNLFFEDGILIFRNLYAQEEEQFNILSSFGEKLGWIPNLNNKFESRYLEDHSELINRISKEKNLPDKIILDYHLECTAYKIPQIASCWNMLHMKCSSESGKTAFIDSRLIYNKLSEYDKKFLQDCLIVNQHSFPEKIDNNPHPHPAIDIHHTWGYPVLRIDYKNSNYQRLYRYQNREPSDQEKDTFSNIIGAVMDAIEYYGDLDDHWHCWSEGDLIIPDLTLMYHAVKGGFAESERRFLGFWAFPDKKESITQFQDNK